MATAEPPSMTGLADAAAQSGQESGGVTTSTTSRDYGRQLAQHVRRLLVPAVCVFNPVDAGAPDATDVFCEPAIDPETGEERGGVLAAGRRFEIRAAAFPLAPGHIIITPKRHILTMGDVPVTWHPSLERCAEVVRRFQRESGYAPESFGREQGSPELRQAVRHMHLHLIPVPGRVVIKDIPEAQRIRSLLGVARFRARRGGYHYVQSGRDRAVMPDDGPGVARAEFLLCQALGSVWDPVKLQATKMTPEQSRRPVAELRHRWQSWAAQNQEQIERALA